MKKIILVIAISICSFTQAQNILIVDNNVNVDTSAPHMFSTFIAANAAAVNGDIIYVQPSITNYGSVTINKEVTVYGNGHTPELNAGRNAIFGHITIAASNVKISGVETGPNLNVAVSGTHSNITIENSKVYNIGLSTAITDNVIIQGNIIESSIILSANNANSTNVTITNNFINSPIANSLQYFNSTTIFNNNLVNWVATTFQALFFIPTDLVAQNNIFVTQNTFNGTNWQTSGTPTIFNNCLTYSFSGVTLTTLTGTGNFDNVNPVLTSIPGANPDFLIANDYHVGSGSLGTDGNEVGIFNGNYDFDMRGYPTLLPYLTEMTISNNMVSAGSNLSVNLKANANKTN